MSPDLVAAESPALRSRSLRGALLTLLLIVLNVLIFAYQSALPAQEIEQFILRWSVVPMEIVEWTDLPPTVPFPIAGTLLSGLFLHANLVHLVLNMMLLAMFGMPIERHAGAGWLLMIYLVGGVVGSLTQIATNPLTLASLVGASGAIAALIGAMILLPRARYHLFIMAAWGAMQISTLINALLYARWISGGLAIWTHVGGFVTGIALALVLRHFMRRTGATDGQLPGYIEPQP